MISHPVAIASDIDDVAMVHQPLDQNRATTSSQSTPPHTSKSLFEVGGTVNARSCRALMGCK